MKRYLKNFGKPSRITVPEAHYEAGRNGQTVLKVKKYSYLNKQGQRITGENRDTSRSLYFDNYPHVIDFRYGPAGNKEAEKSINILVGQVVSTSDPMLFERLWKQFSFLHEVNDQGKIIKTNVETIDLPKIAAPGEMGMARHFGEQV